MKVDEDTMLFKSGDFFLPNVIISFLDKYIIGRDNSLMYINYWSIVHILSGMLTAFITNNIFYALLFHTMWELWQIFIKMTSLNRRGVVDISMDTVMFTLGFLIMKK